MCNGEIHRPTLQKFVTQKNIFLIATDGAANSLHKYRIAPNVIIGDLDSIKYETLQYFKRKKVIIRRVFNQDQNDLEKAILHAINHKLRNIYVMGFSGGRLDHTLNNLSVMRKYFKKCSLTMIDKEFEISFVDKNTEFNYRSDETVSLAAFQKVAGIKTHGLKYPLNDESLEFGVREGTLNSSTSKNVQIEIGKGVLLLFKKHFGKFSII